MKIMGQRGRLQLLYKGIPRPIYPEEYRPKREADEPRSSTAVIKFHVFGFGVINNNEFWL
jgi:hypothetical protein